MITKQSYLHLPSSAIKQNYFEYADPKGNTHNPAILHNGELLVPRNAQIPSKFNDIIDARPDYATAKHGRSSIKLKPFQQRIKDTVYRYFSEGIEDQSIKAPCGSGKTVMATDFIHSLQLKSAVIVHSSDLIEQWQDRFATFLPDAEIGLVNGRTKEVKDITIYSVPTLMRMNPYENDLSLNSKRLLAKMQDTGLVIVDEFHRLGADKWGYAIGCFPSKYRLAFSATPYRKDNGHIALFGHFGPLTVQMSLQELAEMGEIILPQAGFLRYGGAVPRYFPWNGEFDYSGTVTRLLEDPARNKLIIDAVGKALEAGRKVLVISARVKHFKLMYDAFSSKYSTAVICGKDTMKEFLAAGLPPKTRKEAVASQLVIANAALIQEGYDDPALDALFNVVPMSDPSVIEQIAGRLARLDPDKKSPRYVHIVDSSYSLQDLFTKVKSTSPLEKMSISVLRTLRSLGCSVIGNF